MESKQLSKKELEARVDLLENIMEKLVGHLKERAEFYLGDMEYYERKEMNTFLTMDEQAIVIRDAIVLREIEKISDLIILEL